MNLLFVTNSLIPASTYGGKERALWSLIKQLSLRGHHITLSANPGSYCPYATVVYRNVQLPLTDFEIPEGTDLVHFDFPLSAEFDKKPYVARNGGNGKPGEKFALNTIFVSRKQAELHNGNFYIHNGIDAEDYGDPALNRQRKHIHFLGKAAWKLKNLKDSITVSKLAGERLEVIGGHRLNFKMGFRFTPDLHVHFNGLIGGEKKHEVMRNSKALLFPVLWHEPCANAIFESMYFGCPVFATPWGFMPEVVNSDTGYLTSSRTEMAAALKNSGRFDRHKIHEFIMDNHAVTRVTDQYLKAYEKVLNGEKLNLRVPVADGPNPRETFSMSD